MNLTLKDKDKILGQIVEQIKDNIRLEINNQYQQNNNGQGGFGIAQFARKKRMDASGIRRALAEGKPDSLNMNYFYRLSVSLKMPLFPEKEDKPSHTLSKLTLLEYLHETCNPVVVRAIMYSFEN